MTPKYRKKVLLKALFNDPPVLTNLLHSIVKWKGSLAVTLSTLIGFLIVVILHYKLFP